MNEIHAITLEDLGFTNFHKKGLEDFDLTGHSVARIIAEYKDAYRVRSVNGEYLAKITGK